MCIRDSHSEAIDLLNRGSLNSSLNYYLVAAQQKLKNTIKKIRLFNGDLETIQNELTECIAGYTNEVI